MKMAGFKIGTKFIKKKDSAEERQQRLKKSQESILNRKTPFVIQEAYRTARTSIMFSLADADDNCKVLCISSANAGEGKTTTTLNLAITFAQTGSRVLLVDCDLRKPKIHQYLGVIKTDGLTTILSKQKEFEDVVYHNLRPGLDCLTSGSIPPNPAELLASDNMSRLISKLKGEYDYILLDTPPITVVTDAVALSQATAGIMLVVREGYTNHESIEQALKLLRIADAKVLGFFLNDIDAASVHYGYKKNYKRYGRYSYGYGKKYSYNYSYGYGYGYNVPQPETRKEKRKKAKEEKRAAKAASKEAKDNNTQTMEDMEGES